MKDKGGCCMIVDSPDKDQSLNIELYFSFAGPGLNLADFAASLGVYLALHWLIVERQNHAQTRKGGRHQSPPTERPQVSEGEMDSAEANQPTGWRANNFIPALN
jgi:hypothetical protein